ncbi:MAG TPA: SRPBCC domain-containing protein [Devosiaceae bacterium]|nr:SRPBCC domain-containing protein [Devosiaceae bacterium]
MSSTTSAARAIADVTEGTILASVDIMVPAERVFAALSDGNEITRWWGNPAIYTTTSWETDFRVGGRWRADGVGADGVPFYVEGEFIEIERPHRIVQTWEPQWDQGNRTTVTYQLSPIEGGTRLVARHEGFKGRPEMCQQHSDGWAMVLGWLAADIGPKPQPDTAKYFVARLLAPRPDFATSLSDEEMAVMQAHMAYWRPKMQEGKVLVLGPVNDPRGSWGLGLMRVESEEELLELQSHDPAITSGRGLSYENLPMFRAVWKQN